MDFIEECFNDMDFWGEFDPIVPQRSKAERLRQFDNPSQLAILTERVRFVIQEKNGAKVRFIGHWLTLPNRWIEIGYNMIPNKRGKGYGTVAVQLMIDYLFLSMTLLEFRP